MAGKTPLLSGERRAETGGLYGLLRGLHPSRSPVNVCVKCLLLGDKPGKQAILSPFPLSLSLYVSSFYLCVPLT